MIDDNNYIKKKSMIIIDDNNYIKNYSKTLMIIITSKNIQKHR